MRCLALVLALLAPRLSSGAPITAHDRVLVLAPHPDDEAIACGGLLQEARAAGARVRVVFLTSGDANELSFMVVAKHPVFTPSAVRQMGERRRREAIAAAAALGVDEHDLVFLGYPDVGTLKLFVERFDGDPLRSLLTDATAVPYPEAFHPGAPYVGASVLADLERILRELQPTVIAVSHPADRQPDHQALWLFTRVALWDLAPTPAPRVLPYLVHAPGWPAPSGLHPDAPLDPPPDLASAIAWERRPVDAERRRRKLDAIRAHASQTSYSQGFLESFVRTDELFGDFPALRPPTPLVEQDADALVLTTTLANPIGEAAARRFYVVGYRRDWPFATMPKLRIDVGPFGQRVADRRFALPATTVVVRRTAHAVTVRIPLAALGWPTRVLTQTRSSVAAVPVGTSPWREIDLEGGG